MGPLGPLVQVDKDECLSWNVDRAPCEAACPLGIRVADYIRAIEREDFGEALNIIMEECPLPAVVGRVCHHPCEANCKRARVDEPVAIRQLKRFAADVAWGLVKGPEPARGVKHAKVAIMGDGPAGLTCGYYLAMKGYGATIFEALPVAGGMLYVGIPGYRLPKDILAADISRIKEAGVQIKTNVPMNKDLTIDGLLEKGYKAVFIATGAHDSERLGVPGEHSSGVLQGVPFLRDVNLGRKVQLGRKVAVM